jgi:cell division protein FtsL
MSQAASDRAAGLRSSRVVGVRARAEAAVPAPAGDRGAELRVLSPQIRRRRAGVAVLLATAVVFVLMVALVLVQAKMAQEQQRLDQIEQRTKQAQLSYDRLRVIVATIESPASITKTAQTQLGLVPAGKVTYVSPTPADVAAVAESRAIAGFGPAGARGPDVSAASSAGSVPPDWTAVKPLVEGAP